MQIHHGDRLLVAALGGPHRCLSSAMRHGGLAVATQVAWVQVHNTDLPIGVDPFDVMDARLRAGGVVDAVGLMTSRSLEHFLTARRIVDDVQVDVLATVGLSNALRIGDLPGFIGSPPGTINVLARLSVPLTDAALVEAIAMAAEARTAAVREANVPSRRSGAPSTGTGTDALVIAAPLSGEAHAPRAWCGKHTSAGSALGAAVFDAVHRGVLTWLAERRGDAAI